LAVITKTLSFQTKGENDIIDITDKVIEALNTTKLVNGIVVIFVPRATGAVTTI
jgi:thiamine phosphate synthase YjbQ (UPF0047 family)